MGLHLTGMALLRSALTIAAGGSAALGGSYLISKLKDRQEMESRLDRIEQMVQQLTETDKKPAPKKAPPKRAPRPKAKPAAKPESK